MIQMISPSFPPLTSPFLTLRNTHVYCYGCNARIFCLVLYLLYLMFYYITTYVLLYILPKYLDDKHVILFTITNFLHQLQNISQDLSLAV